MRRRVRLTRLLLACLLVGRSQAWVGRRGCWLPSTGRLPSGGRRGPQPPEAKDPSPHARASLDGNVSRAARQTPEDDPDNPPPLLIRLTDQVVDGLTQPQPRLVQLSGAILLALTALPLITSLSQTVVTLVVFTGLALLGRRVGRDEDDRLSDDDDEDDSSYGTDVIAFLAAGAAGFLLLPGDTGPPASPSFTTTVPEGAPSIVWSLLVGWGGLAVVAAVLGQTPGDDVAPEINDTTEEGNEDEEGPSRALLDLWDDEFSGRQHPREHPSRKSKEE
jgi:hypothetical protein